MRLSAKVPWRVIAETMVAIGVGGVGLCTAVAIAGGGHWPWLIAEQFLLHYLVVACVGALAAAALRAVRVADGAALIALVNLVFVAVVAPPARAAQAGDARLRVLAVNVLTSNGDHAAVARLIAREQPDVIVLIEVDTPWLAGLADATRAYPGRLEAPRFDNFGVALYARWPLLDATTHDVGGVPALAATLGPEGAGLTVIATHVLPPINSEMARTQAAQLDALAVIAGRRGPRVVAGDLNAAPWSRRFQRLLARTGLRDSRLGFGIQASFPSALGWAGIPIDHALVSSDVAVLDRRVGPAVGSDHRPIVVDLAIAR